MGHSYNGPMVGEGVPLNLEAVPFSDYPATPLEVGRTSWSSRLRETEQGDESTTEVAIDSRVT